MATVEDRMKELACLTLMKSRVSKLLKSIDTVQDRCPGLLGGIFVTEDKVFLAAKHAQLVVAYDEMKDDEVVED